MIVVIAMSTLLLTAVTAGIVAFYRTNTQTLDQAYALESARRGEMQVVDDVRGAQYGADGSYPLASIGSSDLVFYSDVTGDGIPEKIHYYVSGTALVRDVISVAGTPPSYTGTEITATSTSYLQNTARGVSPFHFYDASGVEVTTITQADPVAYMTVTLIVNAEDSGMTNDYTLRSTATLRNAALF